MQHGECKETKIHPRYGSPQDKAMPTEPDQLPNKPWLTGCTLHAGDPHTAHTLLIEVNGHPISATLDSGSKITLARPTAVPQRAKKKGTLSVACIHWDIQEVPTVEVKIQSQFKAPHWPHAQAPHLPVPRKRFPSPRVPITHLTQSCQGFQL